MAQTSQVLITGATGNVGRHVVSGLLTAGLRVRAVTRNADAARLPSGVDVVQGDLSVPGSLDEHLNGIDAVFLMCRSVPARGVIEAIAKHARRLVFLSSSAIQDGLQNQVNVIAAMHAAIEQAIEQSGIEWTFLRPGSFASNSLRWWAPQIRAGDVVRWPYGSAAIAPIDERDIAALAVRALTEPGHAGRKYVLTGPQSLTQIEQLRIIAEVIGRPLRYEEIPPDAARKQMAAWMPAPIVDMLLEAWAAAATHPAAVTPSSVHTFRDWVADRADDFRSVSIGRSLPDIQRTDSAFAGVSEWIVDTPERQQSTVDAVVESAWNAPWPSGLLSVNLLTSHDGTTVLNYAQWSGDEVFNAFAQNQLKSRRVEIDRAVPGIIRKPGVRYRLYRSKHRESAPAPGCIVIVSIEFDGPDEQRQRRWVDKVFEALEAEPVPVEGGISGHFHLSIDGTRVLNYAEWTTAEAHQRALDRSGQNTIGSGAKWLEVRDFPGVVSNGFKRYRLSQSLSERRA